MHAIIPPLLFVVPMLGVWWSITCYGPAVRRRSRQRSLDTHFEIESNFARQQQAELRRCER